MRSPAAARAVIVALALASLAGFPALGEEPYRFASDGTVRRFRNNAVSRAGVTLGGEKRWTHEEVDRLGRPVARTVWQDGAVVETVAWEYDGDAQRPTRMVVVGKAESVVTEFDGMGREIRVETRDPTGPLIRLLQRRYDGEGRLVETSTEEGDHRYRTEYAFGPDGKLAVKTQYRDGLVTSRAVYESADDWVETLYVDGRPILEVVFVNGTRRSERAPEGSGSRRRRLFSD